MPKVDCQCCSLMNIRPSVDLNGSLQISGPMCACLESSLGLGCCLHECEFLASTDVEGEFRLFHGFSKVPTA